MKKLIQSDKLLKTAQDIFGDIVTNAWATNKNENDVTGDCSINVDYDECVILQFSSGKMVKIWSSEWGIIENYNDN